MRKNLPVTVQELFLDPRRPIVTKTDLKGRITYANPAFVEISGFAEAELIGQPHNVVRHPDMPPAAFQDLWDTIKDGHPWQGLVKNRAKDGGFYWVDAYVTPLTEHGRHVGYMSVRATPARDKVNEAERLYREINAGRAAFPATRRQHHASWLTWQLAILAATVLLGAACAWPATPLLREGGLLLVLLASGAATLLLQQRVRATLRRADAALTDFGEGNFKAPIAEQGPRECAVLLQRLETTRINLRAILADVVSATWAMSLLSSLARARSVSACSPMRWSSSPSRSTRSPIPLASARSTPPPRASWSRRATSACSTRCNAPTTCAASSPRHATPSPPCTRPWRASARSPS